MIFKQWPGSKAYYL